MKSNLVITTVSGWLPRLVSSVLAEGSLLSFDRVKHRAHDLPSHRRVTPEHINAAGATRFGLFPVVQLYLSVCAHNVCESITAVHLFIRRPVLGGKAFRERSLIVTANFIVTEIAPALH